MLAGKLFNFRDGLIFCINENSYVMLAHELYLKDYDWDFIYTLSTVNFYYSGFDSHEVFMEDLPLLVSWNGKGPQFIKLLSGELDLAGLLDHWKGVLAGRDQVWGICYE